MDLCHTKSPYYLSDIKVDLFLENDFTICRTFVHEVRTVWWSLRAAVGMHSVVESFTPFMTVRLHVGTCLINCITIYDPCVWSFEQWSFLDVRSNSQHYNTLSVHFIKYPFIDALCRCTAADCRLAVVIYSFSAPPLSCQSMERDNHSTRYFQCIILNTAVIQTWQWLSSVYPEQQFCYKTIKWPVSGYTVALLHSTNSFLLSGEIPSDSHHAFVSFASGRWWLLLNPASVSTQAVRDSCGYQ